MRLIDCFIELFYYTTFLDNMNFEQFIFDDVKKHYEDLFSRSKDAARKAGYSEAEWEAGSFAVCAWIDEFVLGSRWAEKEKWGRLPLQLIFFRTTNAGVEFFRRLNSFGENDKNIRGVYDYCLALGFRGQYYQAGDSDELHRIAQENLHMVAGESRLAFPELFFPDAYAPASKSEIRKLKTWTTAFFTVLIILIPVGIFATLFFAYQRALTDAVNSYFAGF